MPCVAVGGRGKVACLRTPLPLGKIVGEGGGSVHSLGERKKSEKGKRKGTQTSLREKCAKACVGIGHAPYVTYVCTRALEPV